MNTDDDNITSLYHAADKPGPSDALDQAILKASRDAVEKPATAKGPFSGGWPAAASIAAVIVITVILVPILTREQPQRTTTETDRLAEPAEHVAPDAARSNAVRNTTADLPAPASLPAAPEDSLYSEEQAMPAGVVGSGAAGRALLEVNSYSEQEERPARADTVDSKRSRMQAADSAPFAIHTPEMWEVKISQLIEEGRLDQARTEADRLKHYYPDYSINPSILEKLE